MNFIVLLIIAIEIVGSVVLTSPTKKQPQNKATVNYQNVLGEEDNPTPTPENQSQADTPTPAPENTSQGSVPTATPEQNQTGSSPTPTPEAATSTPEPSPISATETVVPTSEQTQTQKSAVSEPTSSPSETASPSLTPGENQENLSPTSEVSPTSEQTDNRELPEQGPSPIQAEFQSETDNQKTTLDDLNHDLQDQEANLYNNMNNKSASDSLSKENKNELDGENNQVDQAVTPLEKANLLVQFGDKDIQHMSSDAKDNDLDSVVFHAEKFSSQLDKAVDTIQKLPPDQAEKVKQDISTLCNNADTTLRQQELLVGEVDSQTIETARGKCLNYTYGQ